MCNIIIYDKKLDAERYCSRKSKYIVSKFENNEYKNMFCCSQHKDLCVESLINPKDKVYIPVVRGLMPSTPNYINTIINVYSSEDKDMKEEPIESYQLNSVTYGPYETSQQHYDYIKWIYGLKKIDVFSPSFQSIINNHYSRVRCQ